MAYHLTKNFTIKINIVQFDVYKIRFFSRFVKRFLCDTKDKRPQYIPESISETENTEDDNINKEKPLEMPDEPVIPCCMTGCPNCVWMDYAEALESYFKDGGAKAVKEINEKIKDPNIKAYLLTELRIRKMQS